MTTNEPGWVEENQLAERLGWECLKDGIRGDSPDHDYHNWCRFKKGDAWVWKVRPRPGVEWVRARLIDGRFCLHESYLTLERALRGEV
jgi:hypothetical protein